MNRQQIFQHGYVKKTDDSFPFLEKHNGNAFTFKTRNIHRKNTVGNSIKIQFSQKNVGFASCTQQLHTAQTLKVNAFDGCQKHWKKWQKYGDHEIPE